MSADAPGAVTGIDHLVIATSDLDRAAAALRRLGFTLSPRAVHSAGMGTANHTIMLGRDYFELLGVVAPTPVNAKWRTALAAGDGLAGVAVATPGAAPAHAAWQAAELAPGEPLAFSRIVERPGERPDGKRLEARFEIVSLPAGAVPGAVVFACAQLTRDAVWLPELVDHPNTAQAIRRLTLSVPDPEAAAAAWRRALVGAAANPVRGGIRLSIGTHAIDLLSPEIAAQRHGLAQPLAGARAVAMELAVADAAACRAVLARNGIPAVIDGARTRIPAALACGVALTLAPAAAPLD